jgi:anti-anti-sigma regulatory factor
LLALFEVMLKITIHNGPEATTIQLEGKLAGPWVKELESCWRQAILPGNNGRLSIDLRGVTFIDAAGKNLLASFYRHGAEFVAVECMTKAVVDSITSATRPVTESRREAVNLGKNS